MASHTHNTNHLSRRASIASSPYTIPNKIISNSTHRQSFSQTNSPFTNNSSSMRRDSSAIDDSDINNTLSSSVPILSREFVVRRISEGESGRLKEELKCEACGKGYKHISSLAKHLWEHTPEWNVTKRLLISKHQQVQLLEAASILVSMNEFNPNIPDTINEEDFQDESQFTESKISFNKINFGQDSNDSISINNHNINNFNFNALSSNSSSINSPNPGPITDEELDPTLTTAPIQSSLKTSQLERKNSISLNTNSSPLKSTLSNATNGGFLDVPKTLNNGKVNGEDIGDGNENDNFNEEAIIDDYDDDFDDDDDENDRFNDNIVDEGVFGKME
ncbi:hypothetical protein WICMUC_002080 [Wickerhamomyces mucosus]|uniref:C2H2-type domain-containing protein n=1 Tax=Wickerhamomyces mucosus TaxID=1378264 RepID=A0A9P8PS26_9ASCO|nr:hypothetical protein WICMUC_002080 [Wickerhamomyces mucosus]